MSALDDITVLAIDPASSTGWACSTGEHGVFQLATPVAEKGLSAVDRNKKRAWRFIGWFSDLLIETGAEVVVVEDNQFTPRSTASALIQYGLRWSIFAACYGHDREVMLVRASDWEPWARKNIGWEKLEGPDGDIADAKAILAYAVANTK